MKSPFPGMDPFIEGCGLWEDFHHALIEEMKNFLNQAVPERYLVRTGERGYVVLAEEDGQKKHAFKPDVSLTSTRNDASETGSVVAVAAPATETMPIAMRSFVEEEFRESFVEILDADSDSRLVTCIEVLSPANKKAHSPGWDIYLRKRQGLFLGRKANLVEIDLLRGGQRMPMRDPWPASPYTLLVARKDMAPVCQVWRAYYQFPLPTITVPLLHPDPDISLELQPMIDTIYARSRYHRSINYARSLTPSFTPDESDWLEQQLRKRIESA